jgi:glutamine synthetase type III
MRPAGPGRSAGAAIPAFSLRCAARNDRNAHATVVPAPPDGMAIARREQHAAYPISNIIEGIEMPQDLAEQAADHGIAYFLIGFVDLFGVLRAKLVPAAAIAAMQRDGAAFAGFSTHLDLTPADPDMFAIPDPQSLAVLPWKPDIAWVMGDLMFNGEPLAQAPRQVLKRQIAAAEGLGYRLKTGVEAEFFVLHPDGSAIADADDRQAKPCYDPVPLMRRIELIRAISDAMLTLGWQPYQVDHEDANGQFEMNWTYADALVTADRHVLFKFMVKELARQHGLRASFMPKPFAHLTGNGCHAHVSLWDRDGGANLFDAPADEAGLSPLAYAFLGGLLAAAEPLTALFNPTVNSYKRINARPTASGATWSPNTVTFGGNNRTHMVRIPEPGRFELRLADGAVNPYLLQAGILAAGLDGIARQRDPGQRLDINMYEPGAAAQDVRRLPGNLLDALRAFDASAVLREALGPAFVDAYVKLRMAEWEDYLSHLTEWERDRTLDV